MVASLKVGRDSCVLMYLAIRGFLWVVFTYLSIHIEIHSTDKLLLFPMDESNPVTSACLHFLERREFSVTVDGRCSPFTGCVQCGDMIDCSGAGFTCKRWCFGDNTKPVAKSEKLAGYILYHCVPRNGHGMHIWGYVRYQRDLDLLLSACYPKMPVKGTSHYYSACCFCQSKRLCNVCSVLFSRWDNFAPLVLCENGHLYAHLDPIIFVHDGSIDGREGGPETFGCKDIGTYFVTDPSSSSVMF